MFTDQSSSLAKFSNAMCKFHIALRPPSGCSDFACFRMESLNEADFATVFKSKLDSSRNPEEGVDNSIFGTY